MVSHIKKLNIQTIVFLFGVLFFANPVRAVLIEDPLGGGDVFGLLDKIIDGLFTIGLPLATVMILWSALQFMTSGGDQTKITSAKQTLLYALVGVMVLLLAKGIIVLICDFLGASCP